MQKLQSCMRQAERRADQKGADSKEREGEMLPPLLVRCPDRAVAVDLVNKCLRGIHMHRAPPSDQTLQPPATDEP